VNDFLVHADAGAAGKSFARFVRRVILRQRDAVDLLQLVAASSSNSPVVTPATAARRIIPRISQPTCPARRIISISRRVLMTIGMGQNSCQLFVASCQ
jgi:hypothetical protein